MLSLPLLRGSRKHPEKRLRGSRATPWQGLAAPRMPSLSLQLRLAVVEAMGPMSYLMPGEKLEEQLPKLIPGILALYKKHTEAFYISKVSGSERGVAGRGPVPSSVDWEPCWGTGRVA